MATPVAILINEILMNEIYIENNGVVTCFRGTDAFTGKPITRTKQSHPYSYQPFEVFSSGKEADSGIWSDRLFQQDHKKYNSLCTKIWGNTGQAFDNRKPQEIEKFLQLFHDDESIRLARIVEGCNQSSGFSLWYFGITRNPPPKK